MSNAPVEAESKVAPWREVFGGRFWLNYAIGLLVTLWVPLAQMQVSIGGVAQGAPKALPLYKIYRELLKPDAGWTVWKFVLLHWGLTFMMMALVWWILLRVLPARRAK